MILRLFILLTLLPNFTAAQDVKVIHGKEFLGVIFPTEYDLPCQENPDRQYRFTPSLEQIQTLEESLKAHIKIINSSKPNQGKHYGPIVHKNLQKYVRQYVGYIDKNGELIVYVNCLWKRDTQPSQRYGKAFLESWEDEWQIVFDGGSYFWQIRYNLNTNEFFGFSVNGIA